MSELQLRCQVMLRVGQNQVMARREGKGGRLEYRIRWKGFGRNGDTWEPLDHLDSSKDVVRKFDAKLEKEKADGSSGGGGDSSTVMATTAEDEKAANKAKQQTRKMGKEHGGDVTDGEDEDGVYEVESVCYGRPSLRLATSAH